MHTLTPTGYPKTPWGYRKGTAANPAHAHVSKFHSSCKVFTPGWLLRHHRQCDKTCNCPPHCWELPPVLDAQSPRHVMFHPHPLYMWLQGHWNSPSFLLPTGAGLTSDARSAASYMSHDHRGRKPHAAHAEGADMSSAGYRHAAAMDSPSRWPMCSSAAPAEPNSAHAAALCACYELTWWYPTFRAIHSHHRPRRTVLGTLWLAGLQAPTTSGLM